MFKVSSLNLECYTYQNNEREWSGILHLTLTEILLSEKSAWFFFFFFFFYTRVLITHFFSKHHEVGFHSDIVFLGRVSIYNLISIDCQFVIRRSISLPFIVSFSSKYFVHEAHFALGFPSGWRIIAIISLITLSDRIWANQISSGSISITSLTLHCP